MSFARHSKGLMQADAARIAGATRAVYSDIECGTTQYIPLAMVQRLSEFYDVPMTDFLDEFNQFLFDRQGKRIRVYRESVGLGKKAFARKLGFPIRCLQEWENNRKPISQKSWERYFKGRA